MREFLCTPGGILVCWLVVINLVTFFAFGIDKWKAKAGVWRTRERTLFLLSAVGGSVGALLGMRAFHHKTQHNSFRWGIPAILLAQLACAAAVWWFLLR